MGGAEYSADFGDYVDVLRRRWRIVVAAPTLVLALAAIYSFSLTPLYTAATEVLVRSSPAGQFTPAQTVSVETEARLVSSATIAEIVRDLIGSDWKVSGLLDRVSVDSAPETLVLDISFSAADPTTAARGARAFAEAYLEYKRDSGQLRLVTQRENLQDLIDDAERERGLQNLILQRSSPRTARFLNAQAERDTLNGQIALLTAQIAQIPFTVDPGEVILPATPPDSPSSPNHLINLLLGAFLGMFVGILGAFIADRLDRKVHSRTELDWIDAPLLAEIPHLSAMKGRAQRGRPAVDVAPHSPRAEAYRTLRAGVVAMARRNQMKVIAIVAATAGEGKTVTTANLAAALAQADNRVLAISADLRRPSLHHYFGLPNDRGLTDVLSGRAKVVEVMQEVGPNLSVITGGPVPDRPSELLQSATMSELIHSTRERFDFVLIDTPPVLGLADTLVLAPLADGRLLVAQAGKTERTALWQSAETLSQVDAAIDGVVLMNVKRTGRKYGYGYLQRD